MMKCFGNELEQQSVLMFRFWYVTRNQTAFFAKLCVWLGVLCGFAVYFKSCRKVRKGFCKERKGEPTRYCEVVLTSCLQRKRS
jgi:hypothetical protein